MKANGWNISFGAWHHYTDGVALCGKDLSIFSDTSSPRTHALMCKTCGTKAHAAGRREALKEVWEIYNKLMDPAQFDKSVDWIDRPVRDGGTRWRLFGGDLRALQEKDGGNDGTTQAD